MKRFGVIAAIAAVALVMGLGGFGRSTTVKAEPTDILALNPAVVEYLTGAAWDFTVPASIAAFEAAVGDDDGVVEPEDFADVDLDADQLMTTAGPLWILAFVDDQAIVTVDPSNGIDLAQDTTPADGQVICQAGGELVDDDCDGTAANPDGVVVVTATAAASADAGDTENVDVEQEAEEIGIDISIVGPPDEITLTALETDIQEAAAGTAACNTLDLADFEDLIENVDIAGLVAEVVDSEGTALTGVEVDWLSDDTDVVDLSDGTTMTLELDAGIVALNLACGIGPGTTDVDATNEELGGDSETDSETINVWGVPADIVAVASPSSIACDGVSGSTVTATVTDADGNLVVDGTPVRFDVYALGTADPIVNGTVAGDAASTITPLSGLTAGVSVLISSGDVETSVLIACEEAAPPPPPPPPVAPPEGIVAPPTGTGGYLGQDVSGGFGWLALAGLAIGGLTLSLGGIALRRYAR